MQLALVVGVLAAILVPVVGMVVRPVALVEPFPQFVRIAIFGAGVISGAYFGLFVRRKNGSYGMAASWFGVLSIAALSGFLFSLASRNIVEAYGFWFFDPVEAPIFAEVSGFGGGRSPAGPSIYVRVRVDAREVWVRVTRELENVVQPVRSPGRDCLRVTMQFGRNRNRRLKVPNYLDEPFGVDRLRRCDEVLGWRK